MAKNNDVRLVKLTGEPVSKELQEIFNKLTDGIDVHVDDIKATPEGVLAETMIHGGASTHLLKGRDDLRNNIKRQLLSLGSATLANDGNVEYSGVVESGRRLDIVMGLPASGKSSAIADVLSAEFHSRVIDNDMAKARVPEFNDGWGSDLVHKESQIIEQKVFTKALENGDNIVLPKVGSNADKLLSNYIAVAKDKGYSVNVHYVDLDRNKALGRMLNRFVDTGRWLNPGLIEKYAPVGERNKCEMVYEALRDDPEIDGYSRWNNDVAFGEKPLLVETNMKGEFINDARKDEQGRIFTLGSDGGDGRTSREGRGQILGVRQFSQTRVLGTVGEERRRDRSSDRHPVSRGESREPYADERGGSASSSRGDAGLDYQKMSEDRARSELVAGFDMMMATEQFFRSDFFMDPRMASEEDVVEFFNELLANNYGTPYYIDKQGYQASANSATHEIFPDKNAQEKLTLLKPDKPLAQLRFQFMFDDRYFLESLNVSIEHIDTEKRLSREWAINKNGDVLVTMAHDKSAYVLGDVVIPCEEKGNAGFVKTFANFVVDNTANRNLGGGEHRDFHDTRYTIVAFTGLDAQGQKGPSSDGSYSEFLISDVAYASDGQYLLNRLEDNCENKSYIVLDNRYLMSDKGAADLYRCFVTSGHGLEKSENGAAIIDNRIIRHETKLECLENASAQRVSVKEQLAQKRELVEAHKNDSPAKTKSNEHDI